MFTVGVLLVVAGAWLFPQEHVLASGSDGLRAVQAELVAKITTFLLSHDGPSEKRNRYAGTGWRRGGNGLATRRSRSWPTIRTDRPT